MFNLNKKYTFGLFLALFIRSNFSVSGCEIKIFNPEGQECIQDKNRKLYPIWRLGPNTSEEEKKVFLNTFSFNNRTEEEDIIIELVKEQKIDKYCHKLVFGFNIEYGKDLLCEYFKDSNNFIVIEDNIKNIKYIAGLICYEFNKNYKESFLKNIVKDKKIIEIKTLSVCENLQKNGLGSVLLNKLNISNSINYLKSIPRTYRFYEKNGYIKINNYGDFYKINENKKNPIFSKANYPILNIYGIPLNLKNLKSELGFNIFEEKNNENKIPIYNRINYSILNFIEFLIFN